MATRSDQVTKTTSGKVEDFPVALSHSMGSQMPGMYSLSVLIGTPLPDILVVEIVDLLDVAKDDVLLIEDPRGDLLHTAGHFPQVGL